MLKDFSNTPLVFVIGVFPVDFAESAQIPANQLLQLSLQIEVPNSQRVVGTLSIESREQLSQNLDVHTILPFRILDINSSSEDVVASYANLPDGFTLVTLLVTPTTPKSSQVAFTIAPRVVESMNFAATSLTRIPNFLIIERRDAGRSTLYFRLSTDKTPENYGRSLRYAGSMLVPVEIRFKFPEDTTFYTAPPSYLSSNIAEGTYPGTQRATEAVFVTQPSFYNERYLWINFILAQSGVSLGFLLGALAIILPIAGLSTVGLPEEMISKSDRLRIAFICVLASPVLVFLSWRLEGDDYLRAHLSELATGACLYLLVVLILLINVKSPAKVLAGVRRWISGWPRASNPSNKLDNLDQSTNELSESKKGLR